MAQISSKEFTETSSKTVPLSRKEAWAAYVRNRFAGRDLVVHVQRTWQLTEGEARGVVYTTVSQRVIDKILAHRNGGITVEIAVAAIAWRTTTHGLVSDLLAQEEKAAEDARERGMAAERQRLALGRRLHLVGPGLADPPDC